MKVTKLETFGLSVQKQIKAQAKTRNGDTLIRTDDIGLSEAGLIISVQARSKYVLEAVKTSDGMPATSMWAQLKAVYEAL